MKSIRGMLIALSAVTAIGTIGASAEAQPGGRHYDRGYHRGWDHRGPGHRGWNDRRGGRGRHYAYGRGRHGGWNQHCRSFWRNGYRVRRCW